jgi:hypothetical protein
VEVQETFEASRRSLLAAGRLGMRIHAEAFAGTSANETITTAAAHGPAKSLFRALK